MRFSIKRLFPIVLALTVACKDVTDRLPPGTVDPATFENPAGAVSLYRGTLMLASQAYGTIVELVAEFTDEAISDGQASEGDLGTYAGTTPRQVWARFPSDAQNLTFFTQLSALRHNADYAAHMVGRWPQEIDQNLRASALTMKGYAIVLMGEMFCSGIPMSTVDVDRDFTFSQALSTSEVFSIALSVFDSARALATDSVQIAALADVGAARALLNLARYREAGERVRHVPTNFVYALPKVIFAGSAGNAYRPMMGNRRGLNGLPYVSARDARIKAQFAGRLFDWGDSIFYAQKYAEAVSTAFTIASGIEARLIEAEASLRNGDPTWVEYLNALRTDGSYTLSPAGDTLWGAGGGGVAGLGPMKQLTNAPSDAAPTEFDQAVNRLFAERAFWLYLQGYRLGDMRRIIRQYDRDAESVFPTGPIGGDVGVTLNVRFGTGVSFIVPHEEALRNSRYNGCIHTGA